MNLSRTIGSHTHTVTLDLPQEVFDWVVKQSERQGISPNEFLVKELRTYLREQAKFQEVLDDLSKLEDKGDLIKI